MSNQDPDVFNSFDQDNAGDVDDNSYIASDEPMGVHAYGTTLDEERAGETFAQRDRHTLPDFGEEDLAEPSDAVGRLVQPGDGDVDEVDLERDAVGTDLGYNGDDESAEEAAMHVTDI